MIHFEHTSRAYLGGRQVLQGVTFHMRPGEMAFLAGCSGAGESTLLKLIYRTEWPSARKIWFSDHDITRLKNCKVPLLCHQIGMAFQDRHLLMDRTACDNVAIPLVIVDVGGDDVRRRVSATLDRVGLLNKAKNFTIQFFGDEQQRASIVRAAVNKPVILLTDGPTGDLDDVLPEGILCLFEELNHVRVTVLMATYDIDLISWRSYHVLTLSDGHLHRDVGHE